MKFPIYGKKKTCSKPPISDWFMIVLEESLDMSWQFPAAKSMAWINPHILTLWWWDWNWGILQCVRFFVFVFLMGCMMFNKPLFFRGTIQYNLIYNNQANNLTNPEMSIGKLSKLRFDPPLIAIFPHPPRQHLHAKLSSPWVPGWTSPVSNMPTTWTKDEFHFNVKWVCLKMVVYP